MAHMEIGDRYHGDQAALPGMLDFAVNVRGSAPPAWLVDELSGGLTDLGRYPGGELERRAVAAVAARHHRPVDEVLLLAGGAEGFGLLPNLAPRRVALIAPSFTEPAAVFAAWGIDHRHVILPPPFRLGDARVPDDADLVVVGNPTNPTSVLHTREEILALRRPGRILVVDEAFADAIPGEPESLAEERLGDVVVLRSLTKTWALSGLRVGYALGAPELLARLSARRPHWPVSTLAMLAVAACCAPDRVAEARAAAQGLARCRTEMVAAMRAAGLAVVDGVAPFVLFAVDDADGTRRRLADRNIAIRRCDTFTGLDGNHLRAAVRPEWPVLLDALTAF